MRSRFAWFVFLFVDGWLFTVGWLLFVAVLHLYCYVTVGTVRYCTVLVRQAIQIDMNERPTVTNNNSSTAVRQYSYRTGRTHTRQRSASGVSGIRQADRQAGQAGGAGRAVGIVMRLLIRYSRYSSRGIYVLRYCVVYTCWYVE